ncbi:MAG: hypothetical protein WDZ94_01250 [Patescibacteria group bacterium]
MRRIFDALSIQTPASKRAEASAKKARFLAENDKIATECETQNREQYKIFLEQCEAHQMKPLSLEEILSQIGHEHLGNMVFLQWPGTGETIRVKIEQVTTTYRNPPVTEYMAVGGILSTGIVSIAATNRSLWELAPGEVMLGKRNFVLDPTEARFTGYYMNHITINAEPVDIFSLEEAIQNRHVDWSEVEMYQDTYYSNAEGLLVPKGEHPLVAKRLANITPSTSPVAR